LNYTYVALKKILNELVPEQYPTVSNIRIIDDESDDIHKYRVFLGVRPNDLHKIDGDEIREYVESISKYVLGSNETIHQVLFYNPDNL
jgi:hypothetical protein